MRTMRPERLRELVLAGCLLAAAAAAVWFDHASRLSSELRSGAPVLGLAALRFQGQERVVPPALYLAVYEPGPRSLDLILLPPSLPVDEGEGSSAKTLADVYGASADPRSGGLGMADAALRRLQRMPAWPKGREPDFRVSLELGPDARPAYPREAKRRLSSWLADPYFWPRWTKSPTAGMVPLPAVPGAYGPAGTAAYGGACPGVDGARPYDALVLARELRRMAPGDIRLSSLQEPRLAGAWLGRVFGREALPEDSGPATVEVLNASGTPGVALRATKLLRLHGFDVVHFGNASSTEESLSLTDRAGRPASARAIAALLGCPDLDVLTAMEERPRAAVLLELGRDYERCSELRERTGG